MKQTIAQQLGVTDFPFEIRDKRGDIIYKEVENGFWEKWDYDEQGNKIYVENSEGLWAKREYDYQGNEIYFENSKGLWVKREWDSNGKEIYYKNSKGIIMNNRPKPQPEPKPEPDPEPTTNITLQQCLDRGFTVEKIEDPIYKEQHGKDYMLCYLKLSKRHMIDYCNATCRCMAYKVNIEGTILERKYLKDVDDLDFYIRFLASEKVLKKLSKLG